MVVLACVLAGYLTSATMDIRIIWNIDIAMTGIGFFYVGVKIQELRLFERINASRIMRYSFVSGMLILSLLIYNLNDVPNMATNRYGNYLLFWIESTAGSLLTFYLAYMIKNSIVLEYIGINSLPIIGFNYYISRVVSEPLRAFGWHYWYLEYILTIGLCLVLIFTLRNARRLYLGEWR